MTLGSELLIFEHSNLLGPLQFILLGIFYLFFALSIVMLPLLSNFSQTEDNRNLRIIISENIPIQYVHVNGCATESVQFNGLHIYQS